MKMVLLDGALYNQVTQYVFARNLEIHTGEQVLLDDSWFFTEHACQVKSVEDQEVHKYQLNKFNGTKPCLLSQYFTREVWAEFMQELKKYPPIYGGSYMPQILKDSGLDIFVICEPKLLRFDGNIAYIPFYHCMPEILDSQGNVYFHGYFTHGEWFMRHREVFMDELTLPPLSEKEDIEMAEKIRRSFSVSIHIRRGGYALQGFALPDEYYASVIKDVRRKFKKRDPHYFVFSDDIDWCVENAVSLGLESISKSVTFGRTGRTIENNHCDSQLMATCDVMILSRSVYSYYAALLNAKTNKVIYNPVKGRGVF